MASETKARGSYKQQVQAHGDFVIDYVEGVPRGEPRWFVGRGRVAGNSTPIPSGLHITQRQAWKAAAEALGVTYTRPSMSGAARRRAQGATA